MIFEREKTVLSVYQNEITSRNGMLILLLQKKVYSKNTIYEMMDEGDEDEIIEVVGRGRCFNINCEKGDKLQLFDFELTRTNNHAKLVSGIHSFIKVQSREGTDLPKQKFTFSLGSQT